MSVSKEEFDEMCAAIDRLLDADERRIQAANELDSILTSIEEDHDWVDLHNATMDVAELIKDLQGVLRVLDREQQLIGGEQ